MPSLPEVDWIAPAPSLSVFSCPAAAGTDRGGRALPRAVPRANSPAARRKKVSVDRHVIRSTVRVGNVKLRSRRLNEAARPINLRIWENGS